jgi:hypothetical protein
VFACSRLLFVAERAPRRGVEGFAALPPVMQAALLFLRVEPAYVSVTHADCAVETLHVAEQGSTLLGGPVPAYLEMLAAHGAAHLAVGPREGRLYVSRSRLPFGTILGERYLELGLAADGWRVIHPETMPLTEQLSAYANAAVILFAEGSAVHGTELLAAVGDCLLLPRRNTEAWWIEAALRPRARSLDALPRGTPLGSALADQQSGAALEHMGVTLMDFPAVAEDLRRRGLARLQELSVDGYRAAARTDWETYVQSCGNSAVRPPGVRLAAPPEIAALRLLARSQIG